MDHPRVSVADAGKLAEIAGRVLPILRRAASRASREMACHSAVATGAALSLVRQIRLRRHVSRLETVLAQRCRLCRNATERKKIWRARLADGERIQSDDYETGRCARGRSAR